MIIIHFICIYICIALFKELKDALHKSKIKIKIIKTVTLRYKCRTNYMNPGLEDSWMNLGKNAKHLLRAQTQTYNGAHADTLKTYKVLRTHKHARVAHKHRCAVLTGAHTLEDGARAR